MGIPDPLVLPMPISMSKRDYLNRIFNCASETYQKSAQRHGSSVSAGVIKDRLLADVGVWTVGVGTRGVPYVKDFHVSQRDR